MTDAPYRFFDAEVLRTEPITPAMVRVVLGGPDVARMATAGRDQRVKLFLPHPGQDAPVMPVIAEDSDDWYDAWRSMDVAVRGIMRTYTVRELRRAPDELMLDFALHGDPDDPAAGPAARWARTAAGMRVGVLAPTGEENGGYDFRPPAGTDWILLTADESAIPAVAGILEHLPPGTPARVWIDVHDLTDRQPLPTKAEAEITWLVRGERDGRQDTPSTTDAIRAAVLPEGTPYAWIAGESATVKAVRRHLVGERGFDRKAVRFTGYWRRGTSEDELLRADEDA
ncbi:siderophore-interacting protein [Streptomyces liangshanensis]|uniref:Siderophore-interacting protein n=1 Tax=Streptomyces liangshanensis TaxID=2717324 RepID=A0A6G9H5A0_9ACTN|nr:siderophore-interacting protein [Streptomyces liangshanensis]QIQ05459.1 siderophore-interacting protein [Streptomyces liangshanensis]